MAKSRISNLNLEELYQAKPIIWMGQTEGSVHNKVYIFINNNKPFVIYTEEVDNKKEGHKIKVYNLDSDRIPKEQVLESVRMLGSYSSDITLESGTYKTFDDLKVTGDYNEYLYTKGFKFLKESLVLDILKQYKIDTSSYTYTKINVDDSCGYEFVPIARGLENYSDEAKYYSKDVSKFKDYEYDNFDEMEMLAIGCYKGLLVGANAGVGKTVKFYAWSAKVGYPIIPYQCVHNTEADDLFGKFAPKTDPFAVQRKILEEVLASEKSNDKAKEKARKALDALPPAPTGFEFVYGPLAKAVKFDCGCGIDEISFLPPSVSACLNSLLDDNGTLALPNGEVLKVGPNFRLYLTCNPGYRGTNSFNPATINRLACLHLPDLDNKTIIDRLEFECKYHNRKVLTTIVEQMEKIKTIYKSDNKETEITYRNAKQFVLMRKGYPQGDIFQQFDMAFIFNSMFELDDQTTEIEALQKIRKEYVEEIKQAEESSIVAEEDAGTLSVDVSSINFDEDEEVNFNEGATMATAEEGDDE